jgi:hypothetical protein
VAQVGATGKCHHLAECSCTCPSNARAMPEQADCIQWQAQAGKSIGRAFARPHALRGPVWKSELLQEFRDAASSIRARNLYRSSVRVAKLAELELNGTLQLCECSANASGNHANASGFDADAMRTHREIMQMHRDLMQMQCKCIIPPNVALRLSSTTRRRTQSWSFGWRMMRMRSCP